MNIYQTPEEHTSAWLMGASCRWLNLCSCWGSTEGFSLLQVLCELQVRLFGLGVLSSCLCHSGGEL